jgi:nucleoside-diphosphate-sugar epimerase
MNVRVTGAAGFLGSHLVDRFLADGALRREPLTMYGDGRQTRRFCYVDDLIDGIARLAKGDGLRGLIVNVGSPHEHAPTWM